MEMSESVAVHSDKHLQYLLGQNVPEADSSESGAEYSGRRSNGVYLPDVTTSQPYKNVDVLQMGEGNDLDLEWHDEDSKGNNIRFINQLESQRAQALVESTDESMALNGESFNDDGNVYSEVHTVEPQEKMAYIGSNILDSIDMTGVDHSFATNEDEFNGDVDNGIGLNESIDGTGVALPERQENSQFENALETEKEKSKRQAKLDMDVYIKKSRRLKAGFKYREPEPKFILRNRIELGKRNQGSYSQKFLERKSESTGNAYKQLPLKDDVACIDDSYKDVLHPESTEHVFMTGSMDGIGRGSTDSQPLEIVKHSGSNVMMHGGTNIEIPILDEMIREEEQTLKNHMFDISLPEMKDTGSVVKAPLGLELSAQYEATSSSEPNAISTTKKFMGNISHIPKKDDNAKCQTYAQLHSLTADKLSHKPTEPPSSYVGQHLEKKKKHLSYKKYSLKDYADLNKEIVLQRSLGPDMSSDEYLQKKARADRLKEYATSVSMQNKEKLIVKKSRSAPAPLIKERMNESKRAAALEYAKNVRNVSVSRKRSTNWSVTMQRPSSEKTHGQSAVEIMKERHEAEKLAVEKMRQNLASIIKEVKS